MKQEQLAPNNAIECLQQRLKELIAIYKKFKTTTPIQVPGRLRISQKGKYTEYYHIKDDSDKHGEYLTKKHKTITRQKLITPLTLSDDQYITQWKSVTWQGLPFTPDAPVYTTTQGERVRSKSEVLIANALAQHGIPYRYESPLTLQRHHTHDTITLQFPNCKTHRVGL